ncbi:glycoside hydrolase family 1 protein [Nocardioides sp. KIGAM211]|uniref:Glycoside hydrolase family 1 protein n=1 Tax=Nocardioides luti TaxID=2761101 RepID=A0A7X0RHE4_9ACTN|nr:family 1 glycosylhydrolase [Nocardioides luti]MBB6628232.1 glycoside hydrolase family 1 protein [Nocardioides luti]
MTAADRRFPSDFLWGVASAGHQNEGNNSNSDTWFAELVTPTVFSEPSGQACNGYELWREDVALAAGLGLTAYRFSVEWARVEPSEGAWSQEALDHYGAIVRECRARGMAPVVTFQHFTAPHWFAMRSGWLDPEAPALFARFCDKVMEAFGDRIAVAVTMNEPNLARLLSWLELPEFVRGLERATLEAATAATGVAAYRLGNVMVPEEMDAIADGMEAGHVAARAAIKARRADLPVGLSLAVIDDVVVGDDASVRDRKRAEVYERWLELARDDDFIGVQNYERVPYDGNGAVPPAEGVPVNQMGSAIEPLSLGGAVRYAHEATGVPVLVTEHGMSTADDTERAAFIEPSLDGLLDVMEAGVPVLGYLHWTLMDNFEWVFGYGHQLGLHEVDRETFVRTPKPSAGVYAAFVKAQVTGA